MTAAAARVLKTLMALVDGWPVCVIIPSDPRGLDETARFRIRRQVGADNEAGRGSQPPTASHST
jgi:hypothetical protein